MTAAPHTPGPWKHAGAHADLPDGGYIVAKGKNARANARLIAAAPDLLAALEAVRRCPGVDTTDQETGETFRTLIDAAIAKAKGETP